MSTPMALPPVVFPTVCRLLSSDPFLIDVRRIQERIAQHAYKLFVSSGCTDAHDQENWLKAEAELLVPIAVELVDGSKELTVKAHLFGFDHDDVQVYLEPRRLYIRGKHLHQTRIPAELSGLTETSRELFRVIDLPCEIDPDRGKATLIRGTIEITLPKAALAAATLTLAKAA